MKQEHRDGSKVYQGKRYRFVSEVDDLMRFWDYDKNVGLDPSKIVLQSKQKAWWMCPVCHHSFETMVSSRIVNGVIPQCNACRGQVVCNYDHHNSFAKLYPDLLQYWIYEKNNVDPNDLRPNDIRKYWFRCKICNEEYQVILPDFIRCIGCSKCNRHRTSSFGEQYIYRQLLRVFPDSINGSFDILGHHRELDIYVPSIKLAIEYDGCVWHMKDDEKKLWKYNKCKELGITLWRVFESYNLNQETSVGNCDRIFHCRGTVEFSTLDAVVSEIFSLLGVNGEIERAVDVYPEILKTLRKRHFQNSIADDPKLGKMWDYYRNDIDPHVIPRFHRYNKYWFTCPRCGRPWFTKPGDALKAKGCLQCNPIHKGRVAQIDAQSGIVVKIWRNALDAAKELGYGYSHIRSAVRNGIRVHGFYWKSVSDAEDDAK